MVVYILLFSCATIITIAAKKDISDNQERAIKPKLFLVYNLGSANINALKASAKTAKAEKNGIAISIKSKNKVPSELLL